MVAQLGQLAAQDVAVLDDPVVHENDLVRAVGMRVGVRLVRCAVRGPPRMGDAGAALQGLGADEQLEAEDLAGALAELYTVAVLHRNSGRIVASILQPLEALYEEGHGVLSTDVTYYPTHT